MLREVQWYSSTLWVSTKISFKILWERKLESMSRSDIIAVVYNKILGELEGMHDWFKKHRIKLPQSTHWLIHVCTHSHIYSNIPSFNRCRLMKTTTIVNGCISQLKVVSWFHSWQFCHSEAQKWWKYFFLKCNYAKEKDYLLKKKL